MPDASFGPVVSVFLYFFSFFMILTSIYSLYCIKYATGS
jgi:hypothetical protein